MFKTMLNISGCVENMLKISIICVENYVETACWKFQHVLKTVMHVESYVKISRCLENVYVRLVENHIENCVELPKKNTITLYGTCWNWAADFVFLLQFCTLDWSETYVSLRLCMQNAVPTQPCVAKLEISLVLLNFLHCNFR